LQQRGLDLWMPIDRLLVSEDLTEVVGEVLCYFNELRGLFRSDQCDGCLNQVASAVEFVAPFHVAVAFGAAVVSVVGVEVAVSMLSVGNSLCELPDVPR